MDEALHHDELFAALPRAGTKRHTLLISFCEVNEGRLLAMLPWIAAEIGGNDGFPAMVGFISIWGGTRFYVPRAHRPFVAKAGVALSQRTHRKLLADSGPAALIDIPSAWGVFLVLRRAAIADALAQSSDARCVARRFGVTERSLRP